MSTAAERFNESARRRFIAQGRTDVRAGELLRHPVYTRVLHWSVAAFFILALLTGFAIYSPWFYRWLTPLFGGGAMTRLLHPWFSVAFVAIFVFKLVLAAIGAAVSLVFTLAMVLLLGYVVVWLLRKL